MRHPLRLHAAMLVLALATFVVVLQPLASALTQEERRIYAYQGIMFFDEVCAAAAQRNLTLSGGNAKVAFLFFVSKGLSINQAAGIIGNLEQESGVNPKSDQPNGPGMGIAQWSEGGRWEELKTWAAGQDIYDLRVQLNYIWYEMTEVVPWSQTLQFLKISDEIEITTQVFQDFYEKPHPNYAELDKRIAYAKEAAALYGPDAGGIVGGIIAQCGGGSTLTADGYSFPVAPRTKRDYTNLPCDAPVRSYTDKYGQSARMKGCHHDGTPAFDLMYSGVAGQPVYAISAGTVSSVRKGTYVMDSSRSGKPCGSLQLRANNTATGDNKYYWYGHILPDANINNGSVVSAGDQLGVVATPEYGPKCWGGGPHLHIDRGCTSASGPQPGGRDECRDPTFVDHLEAIWATLPEES